MDERLPPADIESEHRLIGSCFDHKYDASDFGLDAIRATVSADMFSVPQLGMLFQAVCDCADNGDPIDPAAVLPRLEHNGRNERWAETLRQVTREAEPANCKFYARQIRETWNKREVIRQCVAAIDAAYDPNPDTTSSMIAAELMGELHGVAADRDTGPGAVYRTYEQIERRPLEWLWQDRLPAHKISLLAGPGGLGKSYLTLDIAARISAGRPWVDSRDTPNPAGDVILIGCEDDPEDTIGNRLDMLGANSRRIIQFDGVHRPETKGELSMFDLSRDLRHLETMLDTLAEVRLVIIDPLDGFLDIKCDANRNADVRSRLSPLAELAGRRRVTILGVMHVGKTDRPGAAAMEKILGSVGFVNQCRAAWMVFLDPECPGRRLLLPAKNNLSPMDVGGLAFRIDNEGLSWEADAVQMTADEMVVVTPDRARLPVNDVCDWLKDYLKDGPRSAKYANEEADRQGFTARTVQRARKRLGVVVQRATGTWALPANTPPSTEGGNKGIKGNEGNVGK